MNKIEPKKPTRIGEDFALWAAEQGALLRAGTLDRADLENVAEEIEGLGRGDKYEIDSRLEILLQHLLKWHFQPSKRSNSWKASIREQRIRISRILEESPSLRGYPAKSLAGSYTIGRGEAISRTGLPEATFPAPCPYTAEQVLNDSFWPGPTSTSP